MAAALYTSRNDPGMSMGPPFPQPLMTDLDFRDDRYPSVSSRNSNDQTRTNIMPYASTAPPSYAASNDNPALRNGPVNHRFVHTPTQSIQLGTSADGQIRPGSRAAASDAQSMQSQTQSPNPESPRNSLSYSLPANGARRVVERYSLEGTVQRPSSSNSTEIKQKNPQSTRITSKDQDDIPPMSSLPSEPVAILSPSAPRHPSLPTAGVGANANAAAAANGDYHPPIIPLSASPNYNPPISPRNRAYPQQPYITKGPAIQAMDPVISNAQPPPQQEEVCIECAMRDEDMADVDVTSPGMWDRESDVLFQELIEREAREAEVGITHADDPSWPTSKGDMLTEENLKDWLAVNPREPQARQQTLKAYIKSQRTLLDAEALARSRAMQEARRLDDQMKDTYSKMRTSTYDTVDETGAVRIRAAQPSPAWRSHNRSRSRDVSMQENGMIVEHVDLRKEEKEERERRRREERQLRKSSRGSAIDVTSLISNQSLSPMTDGGFRQGGLPRAKSQASFSDVYSMSSASPRRSRFFGFVDGWKSQGSLAPSGMSGSMIDMHLALQREAGPVDLGTPRKSQLWNSNELQPTESRQSRLSEEKSTKKRKGLIKFWKMVTSKKPSKNEAEPSAQVWYDKDDDSPLPPPPPLPFLMGNRAGGSRHASSPSLPILSSPKQGLGQGFGQTSPRGMSPPTASSSSIPSPVSSRPPAFGTDAVGIRTSNGSYDDQEPHEDDTIGKKGGLNQVAPPDLNGNLPPSSPPPPPPNSRIARDKSLPPLPNEAPASVETRPHTVYTFDSHGQLPPGSAPAHDFLPPGAGYRSMDVRRQSFNGLASRPNAQSLTSMSMNGNANGYNGYNPHHSAYEFGIYDPRSETPTAKRKSKFGFSSLLGKKSSTVKETTNRNMDQKSVSTMRWPEMDDGTMNGYASQSMNSRTSYLANPRFSMSRKDLEEKVPQDPEFVAYRYPSGDQNVDILR